ncbi:MAG: M20/M25/M40 family metallo-hydrolase [Candidatus Korarchaeum sp.]
MSRVAEVLLRLLRIYSPNGGERALEDELVRIARELGLEAHSDSVGNVIIEKGEARVALIGHYDTVPGELEVSSGREIRGRGAVDAKGPLASMLVAASLSSYPVMVAALVDEEGESKGALSLLKRGIPSYVVVGEPSNTTGVVISYRGSARLVVECRGKGGHSSHIGDSALDKLLDSLNAIRGYSFPGASLNVIRVCGGSSFSVLPKSASAEVDFRFSERNDAMSILGEIARLVHEGCRVGLHRITDPISVKPSDPVPRALVRAILSSGAEPKLLRKYGTSDMNLLAEGARSIAAYGPGRSELAHTEDEAVSADDLEFAVGVYLRAVEQLHTTALRAP